MWDVFSIGEQKKACQNVYTSIVHFRRLGSRHIHN